MVPRSPFFSRFWQGLTRTREQLGTQWRRLAGMRPDETFWSTLEETLYRADLGPAAVEQVMAAVRERLRQDRPLGERDLTDTVARVLTDLLPPDAEHPWDLSERAGSDPQVWVVVGVNGAGKTTTVAKLAYALQRRGRTVLLGAADTFRAAATEQLGTWASRLHVDMIHQAPGADPAAVAYDSVQAAVRRGVDALVIDTAGRLHTKAPLMQELGKIVRVVGRALPGAPHETLLVLDATTGQNGLQQARVFVEAANPTGLVLTKLDGTAKGGVVFQIQRDLGLGVRWVGLGETPEDLVPFRRADFVAAILGDAGVSPEGGGAPV
jgi:fused signal recognition particle receptor